MLIQKIIIVFVFLFSFSFGLTSCFTKKKLSTGSIPVVKNIYLERYLGIWYEIVRLPNSFKKTLILLRQHTL